MNFKIYKMELRALKESGEEEREIPRPYNKS